MKKEKMVKLLNTIIKQKKALKSGNALSEEQSRQIDADIAELERLLAEVDADEDELKAIQDRIEALNDTVKAAMEKIAARDTGTEVGNYLKSQESVNDLFRILRDCARSGNSFAAAWRKHMESKNFVEVVSGATIPGILPDTIERRIIDRWNEDNNWLRDLRTSNAKMFLPSINLASQDAAESGAREHTPSRWDDNNKEVVRDAKYEQILHLASTPVTVTAVYKLQKVDTIVQYMDDGTLMDYIVDEMYKFVLKYIADCVIGTKQSSHILPAMQFSPNGTLVADNTLTLIENVRNMVSLIGRDSDIYLFMTKATYNALAKRRHAAGGSVYYVSREILQDELGVARIITRENMPLSDPADPLSDPVNCVAFCPEDYLLFGQATNVTLETRKNLEYNLNEMLAEVFVGGCPTALDCAATLTGYSGGDLRSVSLSAKISKLTDKGGGSMYVAVDAAETGAAAGIFFRATLMDSNDDVVATDENTVGSFEFSGLTAGDYTVECVAGVGLDANSSYSSVDDCEVTATVTGSITMA